MIVLSIDSSSKVATVAILKDDVLLGEYILNDKREHSVILMPLIENLLKECNLSIDDIDGYVVSKGPGSFTGLRIGMATIKGMSFGNNKPYISISSLDALAYNLISFNGIICPIMDALRENMKGDALKRVQGSLVLEAIVAAENIEANEEDLKKEFEKMAQMYQMEASQIEGMIPEEQKENMKKDIAVQKAVEFVLDQANVTEATEELDFEEK